MSRHQVFLNLNTTLAACGILVALVASPALGAGTGGGSINNKLPLVPAFSNGGSSTAVGAVDVFAGTVQDRNGEKDLTSLRIVTLAGDPESVNQTRVLAGSDLAATAEPTGFTNGWKIWNPVANDGFLSFKFQHTYNQAGTYHWRALIKDEATTGGPAGNGYQSGVDLIVSVVASVTYAANPVVTDAGQADENAWGWGLADPGTNATTVNYVKVTNNAHVGNQAFTVSFTNPGNGFVGQSDAAEKIPISNAIRFACWEDASAQHDALPGAGSYLFNAASSSGSIQCTFSGVSNVMYVAYKIPIPDPMADQAYQQGFTITTV